MAIWRPIPLEAPTTKATWVGDVMIGPRLEREFLCAFKYERSFERVIRTGFAI